MSARTRQSRRSRSRHLFVRDPPGNVEYDEALRTRRNMARRAEALAAIMHAKKGVVVCGMHGKTTTSAMAAHVLKAGWAASVALRRRRDSDSRHECQLGY
jgi:UDP-N-acetylmuramoylalanine-D-glutamate ligase